MNRDINTGNFSAFNDIYKTHLPVLLPAPPGRILQSDPLAKTILHNVRAFTPILPEASVAYELK